MKNNNLLSSQEKPTLNDINLNVTKGSLVAVVGTVGAGKSSLLSALLGELEQKSGIVNVDGSVAFTAQQVTLMFIRYNVFVLFVVNRFKLDLIPILFISSRKNYFPLLGIESVANLIKPLRS